MAIVVLRILFRLPGGSDGSDVTVAKIKTDFYQVRQFIANRYGSFTLQIKRADHNFDGVSVIF